jgi:hypothetical protein
MNALQIIPFKPVARARRSALLYQVSAAILLLALVGGISMSRGEEGTVSEPDIAAGMKDSRDKAGDNDKSSSVIQPAAETTEASGSGGGDEKVCVPAQARAPSAMSMPACVKNDAKLESEAEPALSQTKSDTAPSISDRDTRGRSSRAVVKPRAVSPAPNAIASRSTEPVRRPYRNWTSADAVPVWVGPPPIINGRGSEARAPYVVDPVDSTKKQHEVSLAAVAGMWERVVEAPGAVLGGGKQALYGVLDSMR